MPETASNPEPRPDRANHALQLAWLPGQYAIARLEPNVPIPHWANTAHAVSATLVSITRTGEELSIVAPQDAIPLDDDAVPVESGWVALRVLGTLEFAMVGILAQLTTALADAGISVFAISTYDTDYLLVKADDRHSAAVALGMSD